VLNVVLKVEQSKTVFVNQFCYFYHVLGKIYFFSKNFKKAVEMFNKSNTFNKTEAFKLVSGEFLAQINLYIEKNKVTAL
jgi:hypothetical protein